MPDFSQLMNKPAGEAKKPAALPEGDYRAVIKSFSIEPAPPNKDYSAIIRFNLGLMDWPDNVSEDDKSQDLGDGTRKPIDISKRQMRRDFYDSVLYRLDDFIKSCGVEAKGRSYAEVLPELVGAQVIAQVKQYLNQNNNEIGNNIGDLKGAR